MGESAAAVAVLEEREEGSGWVFGYEVGGERGGEVSLSWVDYDHLCGGSVSPAAVARAVVRVAASRGVGDVGGGGRLDAARVRRMVDGADEAIRACV